MLDEEAARAAAFYAVREIIDDLSNRSGLGNEWDGIDLEMQQEIRTAWEQLVAETLNPRLMTVEHAWGEAEEADVHWRRAHAKVPS